MSISWLTSVLGGSNIAVEGIVRHNFAGGQFLEVDFQGVWLPDVVSLVPEAAFLGSIRPRCSRKCSCCHGYERRVCGT